MSRTTSRTLSATLGLAAGIGLTAAAGLLMGQGVGGANQPVKSDPQYFVTPDGEEGAHLWVREGATLRVVAHGECKECKAKGHDGHEHKEGDGHGAGHEHGKEAPKK